MNIRNTTCGRARPARGLRSPRRRRRSSRTNLRPPPLRPRRSSSTFPQPPPRPSRRRRSPDHTPGLRSTWAATRRHPGCTGPANSSRGNWAPIWGRYPGFRLTGRCSISKVSACHAWPESPCPACPGDPGSIPGFLKKWEDHVGRGGERHLPSGCEYKVR